MPVTGDVARPWRRKRRAGRRDRRVGLGVGLRAVEALGNRRARADGADEVRVGGAVARGRVSVGRGCERRAVELRERTSARAVQVVADEVLRRRRCGPGEVDPPGARCSCGEPGHRRGRRLDRDRKDLNRSSEAGSGDLDAAGAASCCLLRGADPDGRRTTRLQRRRARPRLREGRRVQLMHARDREGQRLRLGADVRDAEDVAEGVDGWVAAEGEVDRGRPSRSRPGWTSRAGPPSPGRWRGSVSARTRRPPSSCWRRRSTSPGTASASCCSGTCRSAVSGWRAEAARLRTASRSTSCRRRNAPFGAW